MSEDQECEDLCDIIFREPPDGFFYNGEISEEDSNRYQAAVLGEDFPEQFYNKSDQTKAA